MELIKTFLSVILLSVSIPVLGIETKGIQTKQYMDHHGASTDTCDNWDIRVTKITATAIKAQDIREVFDNHQIRFNRLAQINWNKYPYKPEVRFRIAYTDDAFLLHFEIHENAVRAVTAADNGAVWEDSCVEFFVSPFGDHSYYNFEFNCIGKMLLQGGKKGDRKMAHPEVLASIERWSSLGDQPFGIKDNPADWELTAIIPFSAFFRHSSTDIESLKPGKTLRANFYKCGDKHPTPHFVSWKPILTEKPDFHRPDFFGKIFLGE